MNSYYIFSHKRLRRVRVRVGPRGYRNSTFTFHTYEKLRRGDMVTVMGGRFKGRKGVVTSRWSFYRDYTYEVMSSRCRCCG